VCGSFFQTFRKKTTSFSSSISNTNGGGGSNNKKENKTKKHWEADVLPLHHKRWILCD
jgi:hypothetical protein